MFEIFPQHVQQEEEFCFHFTPRSVVIQQQQPHMWHLVLFHHYPQAQTLFPQQAIHQEKHHLSCSCLHLSLWRIIE